MPTKAQPKRPRAKIRAPKKATKKYAKDATAAKSPPQVLLTMYAGPGLRIEISASYETACAVLQWLQGQVLPTFIDTAPGTPRWVAWDDVDGLVHLDLQAPGIDVNVRAHQDIALAVVGGFREFLKTHGTRPRAGDPAPAASSEPASDPRPPRDCNICETRDADPKWSYMRNYPCTHGVPMPPQGVRIEDDAQGNPRIVKNEPTNG